MEKVYLEASLVQGQERREVNDKYILHYSNRIPINHLSGSRIQSYSLQVDEEYLHKRNPVFQLGYEVEQLV